MTLKEFRQRYIYNPEVDTLGEGGFAKVYKAYDTLMKRTVALKFYRGDFGDKYSVLAEIKRSMSFNHPNLIRYYDAIQIQVPSSYDASSMLQVGIMEYANAGDLNDFMKTFPSLMDIKGVIGGILKGLAYLHQHGVVHRDIKPQNLLVNKEADGSWVSKIADFGLAKKLSEHKELSSQLLGTMEYMAPEQFNPEKYGISGILGTNIDLWGFGVILFETFTGELPFGSRTDGDSHEQVMYNIMRKDLGEGLVEVMQPYRSIIEWCLVKNANLRVQKAEDLLDLLDGKEEALQQVKEHTDTVMNSQISLDEDQKRLLFVGNIVLSPLLGVLLFFIWKGKYPLKARQTLNLAWWSLAAWLGLLLVIVVGMIFMETNLVTN
ncbi:MAG: serine/threonine-protein kinase [Chitinophagales bacterium]